jgi:hypothetical protein
MRILALDVGKSKSVACLSDRETGAVEFRTVRTRPPEIGEWLARTRPTATHKVALHDRPPAVG